jgi:hypothetical protein
MMWTPINAASLLAASLSVYLSMDLLLQMVCPVVSLVTKSAEESPVFI